MFPKAYRIHFCSEEFRGTCQRRRFAYFDYPPPHSGGVIRARRLIRCRVVQADESTVRPIQP